jgi:uncharacterized protein (DUF362 family)
MKKGFSRRDFIRNAAFAGAAAAIIPNDVFSSSSVLKGSEAVRVVAVKGADYYKNTMKAVELLGGIGKFVKRGDRVVILPNSPWKNPGSYTNPDVTLAVLRMCMEAGAKEVITLIAIEPEYWQRGLQGAKHKSEIAALKTSSSKIRKELPSAKILKYAEYSAELFDANVYINIPIAKDHIGVRVTGNLKNLMGTCPRDTNHRIHLPDGKTGDFYGFTDHLSQCIADLNLARLPNLCVCDVTETITSNGPSGPGNLIKPRTVLAGTDALAVDVTGASLIGKDPKEIMVFGFAAAHKLGENRPEFIQVYKNEL